MASSTRKRLTKQKFDEDELSKARIPKRFWNLDRRDYFGKKSSLAEIENYIQKSATAFENGVGLLLVGGRDSGKTFLLSYALRCLLMQKFTAEYYTLDEITNVMTRPDAEDEKFNVKFSAPHFIALDDVDSVEGAPVAALRKFIRIRRDNGLPTLLGTSLVETESGDMFVNAYRESAQRFAEISARVDLEVDAFRIRKHYKQLKKFLK